MTQPIKATHFTVLALLVSDPYMILFANLEMDLYPVLLLREAHLTLSYHVTARPSRLEDQRLETPTIFNGRKKTNLKIRTED